MHYSEDLNTRHSNNWTIQIPDIFVSWSSVFRPCIWLACHLTSVNIVETYCSLLVFLSVKIVLFSFHLFCGSIHRYIIDQSTSIRYLWFYANATFTLFFQGYCFIEYATLQACQDAISSMNLFDLVSKATLLG